MKSILTWTEKRNQGPEDDSVALVGSWRVAVRSHWNKGPAFWKVEAGWCPGDPKGTKRKFPQTGYFVRFHRFATREEAKSSVDDRIGRMLLTCKNCAAVIAKIGGVLEKHWKWCLFWNEDREFRSRVKTCRSWREVERLYSKTTGYDR